LEEEESKAEGGAAAAAAEGEGEGACLASHAVDNAFCCCVAVSHATACLNTTGEGAAAAAAAAGGSKKDTKKSSSSSGGDPNSSELSQCQARSREAEGMRLKYEMATTECSQRLQADQAISRRSPSFTPHSRHQPREFSIHLRFAPFESISFLPLTPSSCQAGKLAVVKARQRVIDEGGLRTKVGYI